MGVPQGTIERDALVRRFDAAIDDLEEALRRCPDERWEASVWRVERSDPWMWPPKGVEPIPERTEESIQSMSAFWAVAYHCLWFLDFYAGTGESFESPEYVRGGPEELPWPADGAAPLPGPPFAREALLRYADHGRRGIHTVLATTSEEDLARRCGSGHPHAGKTLAELLEGNLAHVVEHGGQLLAFATAPNA